MNEDRVYGIKREPKQQRSRLLIEKICSTTLELVAQRGLRKVNTNLIAEHAGVDISSVYRFFPDKESILFYIAERWLGEIEAVYARYEQDPDILALPWREYFGRLIADWNLPGQTPRYQSLDALWDVYPELRELDEQHLDRHISFFIRQLERFGARGTRKQWKILAIYAYYVEDEINVVGARKGAAVGRALKDIYLDSLFRELEKLLD
jgi:AcrR family transcriptional regulator